MLASLFEMLAMFNITIHHCNIVFMRENKEKYCRPTLIKVLSVTLMDFFFKYSVNMKLKPRRAALHAKIGSALHCYHASIVQFL